ncbi:MAG: hypothetical protein O3B95_05345 [Chloroflexi bacterium]|nr:hypothetical protein [Chloroflexota bacterium]
MRRIQQYFLETPRAFVIGLVMASLLVVLTSACGSDKGSGASELSIGQLVTDEGRIFTFEDFTTAGFKKSKTYDVSDLPQADAAYYGFWGLDPYNRRDYELRFYPSHAAAIQYGTDLAGERTGKNAKLTDSTATWKVGVRDARECHGALGQAQHAASCTEAKYYDYMIFGNLILFCPGDAIDVARQNCSDLLAQLK